jgi:hypothetical protein
MKFLLFVTVFFLAAVGVVVWTQGKRRQEASPSTSSEIVSTDDTNVSGIPTVSGQKTSGAPIILNEVVLAKDALDMLQKNNWSGNGKQPLPLTSKDFDQQKLTSIIAHEKQKLSELTIPKNLEALYISAGTVTEIETEIATAYAEYIAYFRSKGVLDTYTSELTTHVLPNTPDRIRYHPVNDPDAPPTATEDLMVHGSKDYSQLVMDIYPVDVYNNADKLTTSGVFGSGVGESGEFEKKLRNAGLRVSMYHELTHAVQKAYVNIHAPVKEKTSKSSWVYATKTLVDVDSRYFWKWGGEGIIRRSNNREISQESQADGVMYEVFGATLKLTDGEKRQVWDGLFGRLSGMQELLGQVKSVFESRYPTYQPDQFAGQLANVFADYPDPDGRAVLTKTIRKFGNLPAYAGYLNPMMPENCGPFWQALK